MDKVQKYNSFNTNTPSSESYRNYLKVKVSHHAMKTYWVNVGVTPRVINLGTRWRWVVSFTLLPFYPPGV